MLSTWENEKIYDDGDQFFDDLLNDIKQAREIITIEMYLFNDDVLGKKITSYLLQANSRGVIIQIVVDGIGSFSFYETLYQQFKAQGIRVKIFHPIPFYHPILSTNKLMKKISFLIKRAWRINNRNHRKIITIDKKILYMGSFNFTCESTSLFKGNKWKDLGVRVQGTNVLFAFINFKKILSYRDYFKSKKLYLFEKTFWKRHPIRLNNTLTMRSFFYFDLIKKIKGSHQRVWLMTPYFIPKGKIIRALAQAAKRHSNVILLITKNNDVKVFQWLQYSYYEFLLKNGVRIFHYKSSILHAKNFIIDDFMTIGSTNLNHRSLLHDLEADIIVEDLNNQKRILDHFESSLVNQEEITLKDLAKRSFIDKIICRFFFIFRYWF